ncbi:MAG: hypothetical protein V7731_10740 [Amphritea sp.]
MQALQQQPAEVCIYIVVILIFGVISHAQGKVRNFSLWHRRVLTREAYFGRGKDEVKDCGEG